MLDDKCIQFLDAYADYYGWSERGFDAVARKLCEEYGYSPDDREFLMIALGWLAAKTGDFISANCLVALLHFKLNEVYQKIAEENNW